MSLHRHTLHLKTRHAIQILDLTSSVRDFVGRIGVKEGMLVVASPHTTVGVVLNERCEELQKDMLDFLNRLAPPSGDYRHNRVAVDGRPNTHSHLLSLVIPSQVTLVIAEGRLQMGDWQSIFAVELDGPRGERKIHLTLIEA